MNKMTLRSPNNRNPLPHQQLFPLLALVLLNFVAGCSTETAEEPETAAETETIAQAAPQKVPAAPKPKASPSPQINYLSKANDAAKGAISLTQSAVSADDWNIVAAQWQRAINILASMPDSNPNKAVAKEKIVQYQRNLSSAKKKGTKGSSQTQSSTQPAAVKTTQASTMSVGTSPAAKKSASATSDSPKVSLARHLKKIGAKVYGTYWCGACKHQKKLFGTKARQYLQEIECDPRGKNPKPSLCKQAGVRAYPTWEINGRLYRGSQTLETLAQISNYRGDRNF